MKENNEEDIPNSIESQRLKSDYTIRTSSLSSISSRTSSNNNIIISQISNIIQFFKDKKNFNENDEEIIENASQKLLESASNHKIDFLSIKDSLNNSLIMFYCSSLEYYNLKIILYVIEKQNIDSDKLNEYFLSENNDNMNIFEIASELGDIKIFNILKKYLIDNNSLLNNLLKPQRDNIFHTAAKNNQIISLLFYYSFYNNSNCLEIPNEKSRTPLHLSCNKNYYDFSCMLVNLGINMDLRDEEGKTAMFYAVKKQSIKIIKSLLLNGADKNIRDNNNNKCIDYINLSNDEDNNNLTIYNILEDKNICDRIFKCQVIYQSLKNNHNHIGMIIFVFFIMILKITILTFFLYYKYYIENNEDFFNNTILKIEFFMVIADLLSEILIILIFSIFSCNKKKKRKNRSNKIKENKKELYELYYENKDINIKLCVKCHKYMDISTKHCISCDLCIKGWDHHCFWLNTCISTQNHKYFVFFLIDLILCLIFNISTNVLFFILIMEYPKSYNIFLLKKDDFISNENFDVISIIILIIILFFDCGLFFVYLIFLILFIIPFLCDLFCEEKDVDNLPKNNPIEAKLLSSSKINL
jgi:palmitoyltransferase